jgi:glycosyltransferase 2 family protein
VQLLHNVGSALTHARVGLVTLAIALHLAGLIVTGERWRGVIAALGGRVTLVRSTLINLAGIFVRNATPTTGLGGDASRIALLRAEGVGLPQATASFVYVRAAELPAIVAAVLLALPVLGGAIARSSRQIELAIGALLVVGFALWIARRRASAALIAFRERTAHVRISAGAFAIAIAYATLAQAETLVRQIVVAAAFGFPLTVQQSATVTAMTIVGGFVPTVGSVGAIDGSMVAALMICGATAETAVAITLVERAISYGLGTALGAASLAALGGRAILRFATDRSTNAVTAG